MSGIVAIIGRPNVGKSTLFNRLVKERKAIVDDQSGVTRDRHYGTSEWEGVTFSIIDTGGYVPRSADVFEKAIREQVHIAMEEADVLLFMVDVKAGLHPLDEDFAHIVRRNPQKVLLVANKADDFRAAHESYEFHALGLGEIFSVSAMTGSGTGELLDEIIRSLPEDKPEPEMKDLPKFAIVGRPNVGKSSLVNALLGGEFNIVTPISGTTRDSIHTEFTAFGHSLYLVDTAGLRKKGKVQENVEFYSTLRTIKAIEDCNVAILVIDAEQGIEAQDLQVLHLIEKSRKGVMILVNKWDLIEKDTHTAKEYETLIRKRIAPADHIPIVFVSAKEKQRVLKALEVAMQVYADKQKKIPTSQLNEVMLAAVAAHHPPAHRGHIIRIKYVTQVPASIPTFLFFCNHPKHIKENYKRYLENKLRENFGFEGVPLNIYFREK